MVTMEGDSPKCEFVQESANDKDTKQESGAVIFTRKGCVWSRVAWYYNSKMEWFPSHLHTLKAKYGQETDSKQVP